MEETIKKDNKRFDGLRQQIEKRAEKVNMSRQKSLEVRALAVHTLSHLNVCLILFLINYYLS